MNQLKQTDYIYSMETLFNNLDQLKKIANTIADSYDHITGMLTDVLLLKAETDEEIKAIEIMNEQLEIIEDMLYSGVDSLIKHLALSDKLFDIEKRELTDSQKDIIGKKYFGWKESEK